MYKIKPEFEKTVIKRKYQSFEMSNIQLLIRHFKTLLYFPSLSDGIKSGENREIDY